MNKIARPQPVIRRRRVGCLFISTSRSVNGQEYEVREMSAVSALHLAFLLYRLSNARTWRDVQSVILVSAITLINEAFYKICFIKYSKIKFVTHT